MFNFIKKLIQQKEPETEEIHLNDVNSWIKEKEQPVLDKTKQEFQSTLNSINEKKKQILDGLETLKQMELPNPNITSKEKTYMVGNREFYINAISNWINNLTLDSNSDFDSTKIFCKDFEKNLDSLNKSTVRSFTILQEFFSKESGKVAEGIGELRDCINNIKNLTENEKIESLEKIKSQSKEITSKIEQKEKFSLNLQQENSNLEDTKKQKEELDEELNQFKQSAEYIKYFEMEKEKEQLQNNIKSKEEELAQAFSVIERPFKKYAHIVPENRDLVLEYLKSPLKALSKDTEMKILKILKETNDSIEKGKIVFDLSRKIKIYTEIARLSESRLKENLDFYNESIAKIKEIENSNQGNDVLNKENELLDRISYKEKEINDIGLEISRINKSIEKIDFDYLIKTLEKDMSRFSGNTVTIKLENTDLT